MILGEALELDAPVVRLAGPGRFLGRPGALFEIRKRRLVRVELPHSDCVPLAVDSDGRLIAARTSGDRRIRRYREGRLHATYSFSLDEVISLAVSGGRVIAVLRDGRILGTDESTVPRIDYAVRVGRGFRFVDATRERVALAGDEVAVTDWEGKVLERLPAAPRVRLRGERVWRIDGDLTLDATTLKARTLGLPEVEDVLSGEEEWAVGEKLVRFELAPGTDMERP